MWTSSIVSDDKLTNISRRNKLVTSSKYRIDEKDDKMIREKEVGKSYILREYCQS
jgi:hypothetical protein